MSDKSAASSNANLLGSLVQQSVPVLCVSLSNVKYGAIRSEALTVVNTIITKLSGRWLIRLAHVFGGCILTSLSYNSKYGITSNGSLSRISWISDIVGIKNDPRHSVQNNDIRLSITMSDRYDL